MSDKKLYYTFTAYDGSEHRVPLGYNENLLVKAAEANGISWRAVLNTKALEFEKNGVKKYVFHSQSPESSAFSWYATSDKTTTAAFLADAGVSSCRSENIFDSDGEDEWRRIYDTFNKPLVTKPTNGFRGSGVSLGLSDFDSFRAGVRLALDYRNPHGVKGVARVEEQFSGREYRITLSCEKVIGVTERIPQHVIGDGKSSILELNAQKDAHHTRGISSAKLIIDDEVREYLKGQSLTVDSVPSKGQKIVMRGTNIGGDTCLQPDESMHPSVFEVALRAIRAIPGLAFAGIDFMTKDITKEQTPDAYRIIEMNNAPHFCFAAGPYAGGSRPVHYEFLKLSFPDVEIPKDWKGDALE